MQSETNFMQWFREHYKFVFGFATDSHARKIWNDGLLAALARPSDAAAVPVVFGWVQDNPESPSKPYFILNPNGQGMTHDRIEVYAAPSSPSAPAVDALYTMDQMREYADNFHLSRMRVLIAEKDAYERHSPKQAVDALTTGAMDDPMDVLLGRLKSGGDYTTPLYTAKQGNEPKILTRERLAVLVDHHKAHDGSVDSFELADSFIALMTHPAPTPKAPAPSVGQPNATSKAACDSCGGEGLIGSHACPDCCDAPQALSVGHPLTDEKIEHHANAATTARGRRWWTFNRDELITFARALLQSAHTAGGQS